MNWETVKQLFWIGLFLTAVIVLYAGCGLKVLDPNGRYDL